MFPNFHRGIFVPHYWNLLTTKVIAKLRHINAKYPWIATLVLIYLVHGFFTKFIIRSPIMDPLVIARRPLSWLPAYLFTGLNDQGWDAGHYKAIFEHFYAGTPAAWPPLYPLTLRLITCLFNFGNDAFYKSAVLLNFLSHAFIVYAFFHVMQKNSRKKYAQNSQSESDTWLIPCLVLFFPGHNVFFAAYAESYFLAVTLAVFILRQHQRIFWASIVAGLSVLIRHAGIFLLAALFLEQLLLCYKHKSWKVTSISSSLIGWAFVVLWYVLSIQWTGQDIFSAQKPWIEELIRVHVPVGENPHWWSLKYLILPGHSQFIFFWGITFTAIYCWIKEKYLECFYILFFLIYILMWTHRPFPFSRFVSVLFPFALAISDAVKDHKKLGFATFIVFVIFSFNNMMLLFMHKAGEP